MRGPSLRSTWRIHEAIEMKKAYQRIDDASIKFNDTATEMTEELMLEGIRDIELTVRQLQENPNKLLAAKISTGSSLCTSACFSTASTIWGDIDNRATVEEASERIHERTLSDS